MPPKTFSCTHISTQPMEKWPLPGAPSSSGSLDSLPDQSLAWCLHTAGAYCLLRNSDDSRLSLPSLTARDPLPLAGGNQLPLCRADKYWAWTGLWMQRGRQSEQDTRRMQKRSRGMNSQRLYSGEPQLSPLSYFNNLVAFTSNFLQEKPSEMSHLLSQKGFTTKRVKKDWSPSKSQFQDKLNNWRGSLLCP